MGEQGIGFFFRAAGIVAVASAVTLFFLDAGTAEFVITILSLVLSGIVAVICGILMNKRR